MGYGVRPLFQIDDETEKRTRVENVGFEKFKDS